MKISLATNLELKALSQVRNNLDTKKEELLEGIGLIMVASVIENFEEQGRPNRWEANAPATLKRKTGSMILHESGLLKGGITFETDLDENTVYIGPSGPAAPYAAIHNFGGKAGRNKSVTIRARKYLVVQELDRKDIIALGRRIMFNVN